MTLAELNDPPVLAGAYERESTTLGAARARSYGMAVALAAVAGRRNDAYSIN